MLNICCIFKLTFDIVMKNENVVFLVDERKLTLNELQDNLNHILNIA